MMTIERFNMPEWVPVTPEGDSENARAVDGEAVNPNSVEALLAELLGPGSPAPGAGGSDSDESPSETVVVEQAESDEPTVERSDQDAATAKSPENIVTVTAPTADETVPTADETVPTADETVPTADETVPIATDQPDADIDGEGLDDTEVIGLGPLASDDKPSAADSQPAGRQPKVRRSSPFGTLRLLLVLVLGFYVLLVAAWAIDLFRHQDQVVRGVEFEDSSLDGMTRPELQEFLDEQDSALASTPLDVQVGDTTITTDPVTLGMSFDQDAMVDDAFDYGRTGFFPARPMTWLGSFFTATELPSRFEIDADVTTEAAESVLASKLKQPQEPEMILDGSDQLLVLPGNSGTTLSARELVGRLPAIIEGGPPYALELQAIDADPEIDQEAMEALADDINGLTAEPVRFQVLDDQADIDPTTLKSWAVVETDDELDWSIDADRALADLKPLFPTLGSEDQQAKFTIIGERPVIVPAAETVVCCDEESIGRIRRGLEAPLAPAGDDEEASASSDEDDPAPSRIIVLEPTVVGFDEGVAELESLGIVEQVSTFTTKHACCQNRVTNIQRFADLTQGYVIRPDETFSLNGHVGRRTRENGFVADGAINLGILEPQVGGGISQYATTFFNASFYAGLEFVEYQSHSLYISRYPRGREATISWPKPDLKVRNTTPYGILIWNEYTPTSITVSFYSTKHLKVDDLPLLRSSERQCRVDITPRLITYPDGTQVEDSVFAVYRPGEGLDCNGNSTRPELDEPAGPTATPEPPPEPEPEPDAGTDAGAGADDT